MRLTPQSIFVGLIALGLPFAVALGWMLGAPSNRTGEPPIAGSPGGAGTIGAAPARAQTAEPVNPIRFDVRRPTAQTSALPSAPTPPPPTAAPSAAGSPRPRKPAVTLTTLPPLTDPPIPTPTRATSAPPPSSAAPSGTASSAGGLLFQRR